MQVNDITVPEAGTTTEYIQDPIGGWVYKVTTTITVEQKNLDQLQEQLNAAQAVIDELSPQVATFSEAVAALPVMTPPVSATSTPAM